MVKKSKLKDNTANFSSIVSAIPVPGTDGEFSVKENFQENADEKNPGVRIVSIGHNFKKWFWPLIEPATSSGHVVEGVDILKSVYDRNILSINRRKKFTIMMSEIFAILRDCPSALTADGYSGYTNLFYAKDAQKKKRVISINVLPVGISIESYSIGLMKWLFGSRFFRPATKAKAKAKKVA